MYIYNKLAFLQRKRGFFLYIPRACVFSFFKIYFLEWLEEYNCANKFTESRKFLKELT